MKVNRSKIIEEHKLYMIMTTLISGLNLCPKLNKWFCFLYFVWVLKDYVYYVFVVKVHL
ncbi:MAG: hypothetical protein ACI8WT_002904 [Clostridium sp.]|jgi:hypothetical protein